MTSASPRSILVVSVGYNHIIFNDSIVNNCIMPSPTNGVIWTDNYDPLKHSVKYGQSHVSLYVKSRMTQLSERDGNIIQLPCGL